MKGVPIHRDGRFSGENLSLEDEEYDRLLLLCLRGPVEQVEPHLERRRVFMAVPDSETGPRLVCGEQSHAFAALAAAPVRPATSRVTAPPPERKGEGMQKLLDCLVATLAHLITARRVMRQQADVIAELRHLHKDTADVIDQERQKALTSIDERLMALAANRAKCQDAAQALAEQINEDENIPLELVGDSVKVTGPMPGDEAPGPVSDRAPASDAIEKQPSATESLTGMGPILDTIPPAAGDAKPVTPPQKLPPVEAALQNVNRGDIGNVGTAANDTLSIGDLESDEERKARQELEKEPAATKNP